MEFEWDIRKAVTNEKRHGVSFQEAATVFDDTMAITYLDTDHSETEHRSITFGMSRDHRLLVVAHTDRGGKMRIITARLMTKHERKIYEEG